MTSVIYKNWEGYFVNDAYHLNNIIIYDADNNEHKCHSSDYNKIPDFGFNFEIKRKQKKNFSKRIAFLFKNGTDIFGKKNKYDLYIPSELVDLKFNGNRINKTKKFIYTYKDYSFTAKYEGKIGQIAFSEVQTEETENFKYLNDLAKQMNAATIGLNITYYEVEDLLKKFDITPKNVMADHEV